MPNHEPPIISHETPDDDEISLLDLAIVLAKHKKFILGFPFVIAVLAAIYSLLVTPVYTSVTRILPPQQSQSTAAAMLGQLGALTGGVAAGALGIKNPNDLYVGMLKSRTVADRLIERFSLQQLFETKFKEDARKTLADVTKISAGKDGIITIEYDDEDPKRAAAIANAYVEELDRLNQILAVTEASQRRLFFERELAQAKEDLAKSELTARHAMEQGGLANIDVHSRSMMETTARLRAEIAGKEIQLAAMRTFAADRNPDLMRGQDELAAMKRELANIEGATGTKSNGRHAANAEGLDNLHLLRDVKYNEMLFELLAKQYELAKVDEAKDSSVIQVLDKAIEPERRSKPKRTLIVLLSTLAAGFLGVLLAFVKEALERTRQNPQDAERLAAFRRHLTSR